MSITESVIVFLLGSLVGFGFGYVVKSLRTIEETVVSEARELDVLVAIARKNHPEDFGAAQLSFLRDVALLVVVLLVAWASISTWRTNTEVQSTSDRVAQTQQFVANMSTCNQQYLAATIRALNARTDATQKRADANVELQKDQAAFFSLLLQQPQPPESLRRNAAEKYLNSLTHFVKQSNQTEQLNDAFPYPKNEDLIQCINDRSSK